MEVHLDLIIVLGVKKRLRLSLVAVTYEAIRRQVRILTLKASGGLLGLLGFRLGGEREGA